jgi:plastocyanin
MLQRNSVIGLVSASLVLMACTDAQHPTATSASPGDAAAFAAVAGVSERLVTMMDACDPTTFNAVLGPGGCTRNGGITFTDFIAQLTANQSVGAWHFSPPTMNVSVGQTLVAINRGGEEHTFTEVEQFGGGIIPMLNNLSGNPVPARECLQLTLADRIKPGGIAHADIDEEGTEHYQCCIHPWMRVTVNAKESR